MISIQKSIANNSKDALIQEHQKMKGVFQVCGLYGEHKTLLKYIQRLNVSVNHVYCKHQNVKIPTVPKLMLQIK